MKLFSFVEANFLEKAESQGDDKKMWIEGVASTGSIDTDGQILKADGFDISYLLNRGFLNYHHGASKSPSAIIGEPTEAYTKDGKLHIKGFLYKSNPKAREVFDLGKTLAKESSRRRLGFSIEGKATEFDPSDNRVITKAEIKHVAITYAPKNWDTSASVIMKAEDDDFSFEYEENSVFEVLNTGETPENTGENNFISKSEAILDIFLNFSDIYFDSASQVYEMAQKIQMEATNTKEVTKEALDAAKSLLNITLNEISLEKGEAKEDIEKGETEVEAKEDVKEDIEKGETEEGIEKGEVETPSFNFEEAFEKAFSEKFDASEVLTKGEMEAAFATADTRRKGEREALITLIKGMNEEFQGVVNSIAQKLSKQDEIIAQLKSEPQSAPRAVHQEGVLEKGGYSKEISIATKDDIIKALDEEVTKDGVFDNAMMDALTQYEVSGTLPVEAQARLVEKGLRLK